MRAVALMLLIATGAGADVWEFYGEKVAFSESGKRYLIVRKLYEPRPLRTTFEFCEHKAGTPGPDVERKSWEYTTTVTRGSEDSVLARGNLDRPPLDVWVLEKSRAAILFEAYGHVGGGNSVARLDDDGKLSWALKYAELDLEGVEPIYTFSSIDWHLEWWVDESRGRIVLIARGRVILLVDLETGKQTRGNAGAVLDSMRSPSPVARWLAFKVCPETLEPKGWKAQARAALADEKSPASTRLAAALALHRAGGRKPDAKLFLATILERQHRDRIARDLYYAINRLRGAEAVPVLEEYARRFVITRPRGFAFKVLECGDAGIPLLVRFAQEGTPRDVRYGAAFALGFMKTAASRAAFVRLVRSGGEFPRFDDPALFAALAESLRTPGHYDAAIAALLAKDPKPEYAEPLAVALSRHEQGSPEHEAIATALGACK